MSDSKETLTILGNLKQRFQEKAGSGFEIERIMGLSPMATEVKVLDKSSGHPFCARLYLVREEQWELVNQLWREHAPLLAGIGRKMPQPSHGLKAMGRCLAHVGGFIPGISLETYLTQVKTCHPDFAVRLTVHLLKALETVQALGCAHHMIRPCNIMLAKNGGVVLKNAGLGIFEWQLLKKLQLEELIQAVYATPEHLADEELAPSSEIYQLGLVLFEMVTGQPPFMGSFAQVKEGHLKTAIPNPQSLNPNVNVGLARVLAKALAKNPAQRFQSFKEFTQALAFLLPAMDRVALTMDSPEEYKKLKESDKDQVAEQIREARNLCLKKDYKTALRTLDSTLMVHGPHKEAVALHQQIWETMHSSTVRGQLAEVRDHMLQRQPAKALLSLNQLLGVQPKHPQALELQSRLFDLIPSQPPPIPQAIQAKVYLGKAMEAKAMGNPVLAEHLWSQVLLYPSDPSSADSKAVQFEKQLASRGIEGLSAKAAAGRSAPPPEAGLSHETAKAAVPVEAGADDAMAAPVTQNRARKSSKKWLLAALAVVVLAGIAAVAMFLHQRSALKAEAEAAYQAADQLEIADNWEEAVSAWAEVVAKYPGFSDSRNRQTALNYKVEKRQTTVKQYLIEAQALMDQGVLLPEEEGDQYAVAALRKVQELEPQNPDAERLLDEIGRLETARIQVLWETPDPLAARVAYHRLLSMGAKYRDPILEENLETWVRLEIVEPGLAKLERALKGKKWDDAFEITEVLREQSNDPNIGQDSWSTVFDQYRDRYIQAEEKGRQDKMLSLLTVMTRIRPDDQGLVEKKNQLNRDLNQSKIVKLEKDIKTAYDRARLQKAGTLSQSLLKLDSENSIAKNTLAGIRKTLEGRIRAHKREGKPSEALKVYQTLDRIFHWKTYSKEIKKLRSEIRGFDQKVAALRTKGAKFFDEQKKAMDLLIEKNPDFQGETNYQWLIVTRQAMVEEHRRLTQLVKWESGARENVNLSYQAILDRLSKEKGFRFRFAKNRLAAFQQNYRTKIKSYQGNVTLVIRGAKNLPKEQKGLNRAPEAFCKLATSGRTFTTGIVNNNHDPSWGYTCNFNAEAGSKLTFTIFDQEGRSADEVLGVVELKSVPKNGKNIVLKPRGGGWQIIIDVRRER